MQRLKERDIDILKSLDIPDILDNLVIIDIIEKQNVILRTLSILDISNISDNIYDKHYVLEIPNFLEILDIHLILDIPEILDIFYILAIFVPYIPSSLLYLIFSLSLVSLLSLIVLIASFSFNV